MIGKYELVIQNDHVRYQLTLDRQVTLLKGYSGSGKTTLVQLCEDLPYGGVQCNMADRLEVLGRLKSISELKRLRQELAGKIVVCDERNSNLFHTLEFADFIKHSDSYFLLISRSGCLDRLPYSIKSVFVFDGEERLHYFKPKYIESRSNYIPDGVITEDKGIVTKL